MTGHRTVIIRHAKLRRGLVSGVDIREIVLWQRSDVLYQVAYRTPAEWRARRSQPRSGFVRGADGRRSPA